MSFLTIARMVADEDLRARCLVGLQLACPTVGSSPLEAWWWQWRWGLCSSPGWSAAWESALALSTPPPAPGADPGVITDGMITAAIAGLIANKDIGAPEQPRKVSPRAAAAS